MDSADESYISIQYSNHWKDILSNSYRNSTPYKIQLHYNRQEGIRKVENPWKYCQINSIVKGLNHEAVNKQILLKVEIKT